MKKIIGMISVMLVVTVFIAPIAAQIPDFQVTGKSITFSNNNPIEGEEIIIWVEVRNVGTAIPTMNEDLVVDLYEGHPDTSPLQIVCKDVILELKVGKAKRVSAKWQPPAGETKIYAVVNPAGEKHIEEKSILNNTAHATISARKKIFPNVTQGQIQASIDSGVAWIESRQGKNSRNCLQCGAENQIILSCYSCGASLKGLPENFIPGPVWNFGEDRIQETSLALQTLFASGKTTSDQSVKNGLDFLLAENWNELAVYQYAVLIPVLVATQNPEYRERVQFAINQLVEKQLPVKGSEFADARDDGGWGYGYTADGAHMNMVIYALYAAKQWNIDIPQQTWERAEKWIGRNQTDTGGWLYNLVDDGSPWAIGVYGSMTATGLWALRACGVSVEDTKIQNGIEWIRDNWTLTRNPGSNSWLYYYLLSLQRFSDIPPKIDTIAGHDWYNEISAMMVSEQQPDGRWHGAESDFLATCFAVMTLSRALVGPTEANIGVVPSSLRFSPPSPRVGEAVRLSATLRNSGTALDKTINVKFSADGVEVKSTEVLWTSTLDETVVTVDWVPKKEGKHQISVLVDLDDLNISDNTASAPVEVFPKSTSATDLQLAEPKKIGDEVFQLGTIVFDTKKNEITFPGEINITSGDTIIEFFGCGLLGKTHESILILDAEPIYLFIALGMLDLEPGHNLNVEGDPHDPKGSKVQIWVEWEREDKVVVHTARELVWNTFVGNPMEKTPWVFTGGRIKNNQLTSQLYHNLIAVYRDPDALINNPLPGGTDDRTYRVNTDVIPPKGTKVKVIIRPI
ncbi:hypothetical protein JT359_15190 [Candidatus Poribacteria bacterium]|nr:hypothetical protein [Candidatus Poribacteria bacterium]